MDDPPKVTRDIRYDSEQQSKARIADTLTQLHAFGDQFGRYSAEDIDPLNYLKVKSLLLDLKRELEKEHKNELLKEANLNEDDVIQSSRGTRATAIKSLISHIEDNMLLDVAVLNTYLNTGNRAIQSYDPDVVRKLYRTVKSLGQELRDLPRNI